MKSLTVLWFRDDLRLADNLAVARAASHATELLPIYIHDPQAEGQWAAGAARRWWRHHSLASLDRSLRARGSGLTILSGPTQEVLEGLHRRFGMGELLWNRRYLPATRPLDAGIKKHFTSLDVRVQSFPGSYLFEPWELATGQGNPYRVFTPFYRSLRSRPPPSTPLSAPQTLPPLPKGIEGAPLESLGLLPRIPWDGGLGATWTPGEAGAARDLERFLEEAAQDYSLGRDIPSQHGTSRLSPRLAHGELSPRQIWDAVSRWTAEDLPHREAGGEAYLREICWREFAGHLLYHFPHTPTDPLQERFAAFPFRSRPEGLSAWQLGQTGYPIVDAGLRELWHTGWMHNRVRMIVASFLIKDLLVPWQAGAEWFWDTLVDADLANNTLGWQWVAGCGADAAPFHRIFNPSLQGKRFDPDGSYVRRWIPELASHPTRTIHEPWRASSSHSPAYPSPLVDHTEARRVALLALESLRTGPVAHRSEIP